MSRTIQVKDIDGEVLSLAPLRSGQRADGKPALALHASYLHLDRAGVEQLESALAELKQGLE